MLSELMGLDGFPFILDYFLPIGCLIIGWCDFLINSFVFLCVEVLHHPQRK